jgi:hypothetical protein
VSSTTQLGVLSSTQIKGLTTTEDMRRVAEKIGVKAFMAKQKPDWTGQ